MAIYLGLDTSNYTSSVALYNTHTQTLQSLRKPLAVAGGRLGLRQSDAVFAHVQQLGSLLQSLLESCPPLAGVGVSARPRNLPGSYMPCFLVGELAAQSVAAGQGLPCLRFSHQEGHIMAALQGCKRPELAEREFLALHFSGGTTDCLHVLPNKENSFTVTTLYTSCDLKAGQAVDRVGASLGLPFPAGPALDALALQSTAHFTHKPAFRQGDVCLSGIENICEGLLQKSASAQDIACCCLEYIAKAADKMTAQALERFPGLPVVYAGGVMCSSFIRRRLEPKYGGLFAPPELSADNACGIAILAARRAGKEPNA